MSLLAGIDLLTGKVHACVEERHRSREYLSFLKRLDAAYPTDTAIKLILDNHSVHISKETNAWLATQPEGRFSFVFTPKHASWLNLVEGFFSKMARSMLRHICVASKPELKARILAYLDDINADPVVHLDLQDRRGRVIGVVHGNAVPAGAYVLLVSDEASYITSALIPVTGGRPML